MKKFFMVMTVPFYLSAAGGFEVELKPEFVPLDSSLSSRSKAWLANHPWATTAALGGIAAHSAWRGLKAFREIKKNTRLLNALRLAQKEAPADEETKKLIIELEKAQRSAKISLVIDGLLGLAGGTTIALFWYNRGQAKKDLCSEMEGEIAAIDRERSGLEPGSVKTASLGQRRQLLERMLVAAKEL